MSLASPSQMTNWKNKELRQQKGKYMRGGMKDMNNLNGNAD